MLNFIQSFPTMPQYFTRQANLLSRASIAGAAFGTVGVIVLLGVYSRSPYATGVGAPVAQPVAFSHAQHVGDEGFHCRYCHTSVETSSFAGMPSTSTCMTCHSHIWAQSPLLAVVRESDESGWPIRWNRVYELPDFAYFDHSVHVLKGFGCETCHGRVDQMPVVTKAESLQMAWCLDCHRHPEQYVRPREHVYDMGWQPQESQSTLGPRLVQAYAIQIETSCSVCHR